MIIHVDGGTLGEINPSPAGIYWSFGFQDGDEFRPIVSRATSTCFHTSNEAEYVALNDALNWLLTFQIPAATIRSDSQVIVRQINGQYEVHKPQLQELWRRSQQLLAELQEAGQQVTVEWVRREENVVRLGH